MGYFFIGEGESLMKKLLVVLVAIFLLAIIACSSKGDSSSGSSTSSTTTSATVNSTGGSVQLADGANVTIPAGVVADNTSVTLTRLAQPQLYASQATAVTDTYQITIPAGSITAQSSGSNNVITFQIPIPSSVSASVKKVLSHMKAMVTDSIPADAYYASELGITNGTSTNVLYGTYFTPLSGQLTINAPVGAFTSNSESTTMTTTGISMANYYNVQPSMNSVIPSTTGGSPTFTPVSVDQTTNLAGTTPIILIHGWQYTINNPDPMQDCWDDFIKYFNLDSSLYGKFTLYSFDYPTSNHVKTNAQNLASLISTCFPSQKVIIIAHSMGGLVAHSYIQDSNIIPNGSSKVIKLITLGTPYHGSPLMQLLHDTIPGEALMPFLDHFFVLSTPGSFDLQWDKYNGDSGIPDPNLTYYPSGSTYYLTTLYTDLQTQYANLYCAFAGSIDPTADGVNTSGTYYPLLSLANTNKLPHGQYDVGAGVILKYGNGYISDGVVPIVSAFATNTTGGQPSGFVTMGTKNDYDHSQMTGKSSTDQLFDQIGGILLTTPIIKSVSDISTQQTQTITISGSGFGTSSPYSGDSNYIAVGNNTQVWQAGYTGPCNSCAYGTCGYCYDTYSLIVNSWTDSQIVLGGFTGGGTLNNGDSIQIVVGNPQAGTPIYLSTGALSSNAAIFYTIVGATPQVSISANPTLVNAGDTSTISWSASDVNSCIVSGPGLSSTNLSGSQVVTISTQQTYTITCQTNASPITQSATVNVVPGFNEF
jgi:triacylglycerol esterase/lipase EstA (alpha/beta hydrolase family)